MDRLNVIRDGYPTLIPSMLAMQDAVCSDDLLRVISAAVVNRQFRRRLLHNPVHTVADGYLGRPFVLSAHEHALLDEIQASTLEDFATALVSGLSRVTLAELNHRPRLS